MSREQINDIAKELCKHYLTDKCKGCNDYGKCMVRLEAEWIYEAGYRKASEVAEKIFAEIEKCSEVALMNGHIETPILCIGFGVLAELKKKYTERCDGNNE